MTKPTIPLSLMVENVQKKLRKEVLSTMEESRLPAYLIDLILCDILSEVRQREYFDMSHELAKAISEAESQQEEDGGGSE